MQLTCVDDKLPIVRSNFIITFSKILQTIPSIRRNEGHIFRAFILPDIEKLVEDTDQRVRITFAMHFAQLAETAMKFLELSYLSPSSTSSQDLVYGLHDEDRYPFDVERMLLLRYFQSLLEKLILKQGNPVKRALLEHGMGKLCQVFGRKLTRELILPHLVTFLNEKVGSAWNLSRNEAGGRRWSTTMRTVWSLTCSICGMVGLLWVTTAAAAATATTAPNRFPAVWTVLGQILGHDHSCGLQGLQLRLHRSFARILPNTQCSEVL